MFIAHVEIGHFGVGKSRAEVLCLFVHVENQLWTIDPFGKSRIIFHQRSRGKLAARLASFQNKRI